jgi:hypothetical protein
VVVLEAAQAVSTEAPHAKVVIAVHQAWAAAASVEAVAAVVAAASVAVVAAVVAAADAEAAVDAEGRT